MSFEGEDWTQAEQTTGTAAGGRVGSALARVMNETHFGWSLTSEEALKLVHGGQVTFTRTGKSCANATGVASNSCWGRATSRTTIEVYLDAGDVAGNDRWFVHELGHTFEASVGNSLPSKALQQAQDADTAFPNRVAGADGIVDPAGTWGFAGPRWTWQQSASPAANEEFADMYVGWAYGQFANTTDGQMRSAFMDGYMSLWTDLALGQ